MFANFSLTAQILFGRDLQDEHISVKGHADVALDTSPFNGHVTGADTLWAGVPLITMPGDRMQVMLHSLSCSACIYV